MPLFLYPFLQLLNFFFSILGHIKVLDYEERISIISQISTILNQLYSKKIQVELNSFQVYLDRVRRKIFQISFHL